MQPFDPERLRRPLITAGACLLFSLVNFLLFCALLRWQGCLPFNPQRFGTPLGMPGATPMPFDLAFNTAVSFITNTSWQAYPGEATLSYFAQMVGICVRSLTSAAAGMAVAIAMIRGFVRQSLGRLGNFGVDLTRSIVYVLLPLSFLTALLLCSQGVIQNLRSYRTIRTVEESKQTISLAPVASQESIKLLSSDGGGFFNANSAHSRKRKLAATIGTMPTSDPLFVCLLIGTIFLVTALTFLPAFSLGPIAEHYQMRGLGSVR